MSSCFPGVLLVPWIAISDMIEGSRKKAAVPCFSLKDPSVTHIAVWLAIPVAISCGEQELSGEVIFHHSGPEDVVVGVGEEGEDKVLDSYLVAVGGCICGMFVAGLKMGLEPSGLDLVLDPVTVVGMQSGGRSLKLCKINCVGWYPGNLVRCDPWFGLNCRKEFASSR